MISRQLYALLLATVLATLASQLYLPAPQENASAESVLMPDNVPEGSPAASGTRQRGIPGGRDLFASQLPPPPAPLPAVIAPLPPPELPHAPPVPFQYLGLMEEDNVLHIYLKHGEDSVVTQVGEMLEGGYFVNRLDKQGVHVTYLPLKEEQLILISR